MLSGLHLAGARRWGSVEMTPLDFTRTPTHVASLSLKLLCGKQHGPSRSWQYLFFQRLFWRLAGGGSCETSVFVQKLLQQFSFAVTFYDRKASLTRSVFSENGTLNSVTIISSPVGNDDICFADFLCDMIHAIKLWKHIQISRNHARSVVGLFPWHGVLATTTIYRVWQNMYNDE